MKSPVTYKKLYYVASPFANRCRSLRPNIWLLLSFISGVPATLLLGASSDQMRPLTESFQYSAPREYKLFLYTTSRLSLVRFRSGYDYLQWLSLEGVCDCSHASPVDHRRPDSKNLDHCGHFFDAFWDVFVLADEIHCLSSQVIGYQEEQIFRENDGVCLATIHAPLISKRMARIYLSVSLIAKIASVSSLKSKLVHGYKGGPRALL